LVAAQAHVVAHRSKLPGVYLWLGPKQVEYGEVHLIVGADGQAAQRRGQHYAQVLGRPALSQLGVAVGLVKGAASWGLLHQVRLALAEAHRQPREAAQRLTAT
jgi:hypothetical protein